MRTIIGRNIQIREPTDVIIQYAKETLELPNPTYIKKQRMGFWVGREPKTLKLYEWRGNTLHLPFGLLRAMMPMLREGIIETDFRQDTEIDYGAPIPLYDYQQDAVQRMVQAKYGILQSPAGSGKTQGMLAVIQAWKRPALWLCHTADLLNQSRERAERYMDASLMGTITEGKVNIGQGITFATVQTMCNLDLPLYRDAWDVVVVDECFPGDAMVTTARGQKPIRQITLQDRVLTVDGRGQCSYQRVTKLYIRKPRDLMTVHLANGMKVTCTGNHPLLTKRGYRRADELDEGDEACCLWAVNWRRRNIMTWSKVTRTEEHKQTSDGCFGGLCGDGCVYNLEVQGNHNYFVNGVNVHNCHRISGSPTQMTRYYKVLNNLAARHKYGTTATPDRSDGLIKATKALIGDVAHIVPADAVAERVMKVGIRRVDTASEITDDCLNEDGTINYTALITALCEDEQRSRQIADNIAMEEGHSCLVLSDRLAHLETIMRYLPEDMRRDAAFINGQMTSKTAKAQRAAAIEQMRTGEKKYLFATYSLAKEGLDVPCLDRLFLASPVKYKAIVIQAVGRVARASEGKDQPIVYDFVDGNIGFCEKAYKERCRHYRKLGSAFL